VAEREEHPRAGQEELVQPRSDSGPTFADVDADGAFAEAFAGIYGESRATFLRRATFAGAALFAALAAPDAAEARTGMPDRHILNFDLVFEYLQSSFYLSGVRVGTVERMARPKQVWAHTLGAHELAHVHILRTVLGRDARSKPFFDFRGVTEDETSFTRTAVAMEDLTVALLAGQVARFRNRAITAAAFSLLTVEARHAAWARHIVGFVPVAKSFDQPRSLAAVGRVVKSTRFIAAEPKTRSRRRPRFTG
jgi:hypothetical protein